jgi:hypothetical protein
MMVSILLTRLSPMQPYTVINQSWWWVYYLPGLSPMQPYTVINQSWWWVYYLPGSLQCSHTLF